MRHPKATLPGTPRVPEMPGLANSSLLLVRIPSAGSTAPRPSRALTGSPPGRPSPLSAVAPSPFPDIHPREKADRATPARASSAPRRPRPTPRARVRAERLQFPPGEGTAGLRTGPSGQPGPDGAHSPYRRPRPSLPRSQLPC